MFADLALSRRLERAEGLACRGFAEARLALNPHCASEWMEHAGATCVFDGKDSPITQTFGLGLFEPLTVEALDVIERFFRDRGAPSMHEVSPLVGVPTLDLLCERGYRPMEISNVLYRQVEQPAPSKIKVRLTGPAEAALWSRVSAEGWAQEHPEFLDFMKEMGAVLASRRGSFCFLAELDGQAAAAGVMYLNEGVALFGGASTLPAYRRRGLQSALLAERMRVAAEHGCDLAVMIAEAGSSSQHNAERKGFRIAYTRTKWRLPG